MKNKLNKLFSIQYFTSYKDNWQNWDTSQKKKKKNF